MGTHHILINEIFKLKISTDIDWKMETERNINRVSGNKIHRLADSWIQNLKNQKSNLKRFKCSFFSPSGVFSRRLCLRASL